MKLNELFDNMPDIEIKQLSIDSRVPMKDCIFFCLNGIRDDGHDYASQAVKNGASVIVCEKDVGVDDAIIVNVDNVANCLNEVATKFYNDPASKLETYISCGCDGTSSINYILKNILDNYKSCASIGSSGISYKNSFLLCNFPTLNILDNVKYMSTFVKENIKVCLFEANAQSLFYKKLDATRPNIFIYSCTNLDSSEYKEVSNNYYKILCNYLYSLDDSTFILLNRDDISYSEIVKACGKNTYSYGFDDKSDFRIEDVCLKANSSSFSIVHDDIKYDFTTKLVGLLNIYNLVSCLSALYLMGYDLNEISLVLAFLEPFNGVLETVNVGQDYNVYVDCARNRNSIENALKFVKSITNDENKIITLYGINTNDDKDKIEDLINVINEYSDQLVITENNTYYEDLNTFVEDNIDNLDLIKHIVVNDRAVAIEMAIELLNKGDSLIIFGKGNEEFLIRNMGKESYAGDYNIANNCIINRLKSNKIVD